MNDPSSPDFIRYEAPAAGHRLLGLVCSGFGSLHCKRAACGPRTLDCYGAVHVVSGSGWLKTAATTDVQPIEGGSLLWLFPGIEHSYAPSAGGWEEQWVLFDGTTVDTFVRLGFLSSSRPVVVVRDAPEIPKLFAQLRQDFEAGGPFSSVLGAAVVYRLIVLARRIANDADQEHDGSTPAVQRAIALLEEGAFQSLDLAQLARTCGMAPSTLRRAFKQVTGYAPKEYSLRVRLTRAKELLALTPRSVADIAAAVGFADPYYFGFR